MIKDGEIILYGAGKAGLLIYNLLQLCDITVKCFADNNPAKNNTVIVNGVKAYLPENIEKDNVGVIVCVSNERYKKTKEDAINKGFSDIIELSSFIDGCILHDNIILKQAFKLFADYSFVDIAIQDRMKKSANANMKWCDGGNSTKDKIAAYTSIFGDYDIVHPPLIYPDNIDYYFVSDNPPAEGMGNKWIDAKDVVPSSIVDPILRNRYVKMHPHLIFPEYRYTYYYDGALQIVGDISGSFGGAKTGLSAFAHYERDCLYYEALQIVNFQRIVPNDAYDQVSRYLKEGMPIHFGLFEMAVIASDLKNPASINILDQWWEEFEKGALRDQLSFTYVLWRNGYSITDVSCIGTNFRSTEHMKYYRHPKYSELISNQHKHMDGHR